MTKDYFMMQTGFDGRLYDAANSMRNLYVKSDGSNAFKTDLDFCKKLRGDSLMLREMIKRYFENN